MLRFKADRRTIVFLAFYFVLLGYLWFQTPTDPLVFVPSVALLCVVSWISAVITHNTIHSPMWKNRWLNKLTQIVLTLTYGFPVSEYIPGHNLSHHKHTQSNKDVMRTTKVRFNWNLLNILAFFPRVAFDVLGANMRYVRIMKEHHKRWYHQYLIELSVGWGVKILALAIDWRKALVLIFLPHVYAVWGITTVNFLQHDGCDADTKYNHSRNFVGKIFNYFTFNNGYHAMHHEEPGLHWSLLPEEHEKRYKPFMDARLDEPSLLLYVLRTFIWPAKRVTFRGDPVVLPPAEPDADWIPLPKDVPADVSLGAEAL